ncbi:CHAT domain-containing protein [Anaerolineae bacterium CFX7]|nr:CHAT domain-containing protein [Anaerolineae bacterium CFX7]
MYVCKKNYATCVIIILIRWLATNNFIIQRKLAMQPQLVLAVSEYRDPDHWRWELKDAKGNVLADHTVALDPNEREYLGFINLAAYANSYRGAYTYREILNQIGAWMGDHVFGNLRAKLRERMTPPTTIVQVNVPRGSTEFTTRPFELAYLDGKPLVAHGIRFVYVESLTPNPSPSGRGAGGEGVGGEGLRILAIFSLPTDENPLNLRRERYELTKLVRNIAQTRGVALELRVIQYGATRAILREALEDAHGWDVIHFSGHGTAGVLVLEDEHGKTDLISDVELQKMLLPARGRLQLLTLSACLSGAGTTASARRALGLDTPPMRDDADATARSTPLPSLAQTLARELDCAALAMRFPVIDDFATDLALALYDLALDKHQPLPNALQLSLARTAPADEPFSEITPALFGARAGDLKLTPPKRPPQFELPATTLIGYFPPEPERFVGRVLPMLHATNALAKQSAQRGVLFYGMAGAGKTYCALELAYRHERERFTGYVWYKAPNEDREFDIQSEFTRVLTAIETQLHMTDGKLFEYADDPKRFIASTLPRLKTLLQDTSVLIALDNLESWLTPNGAWRDEKFGALVETLLAHNGLSRVILTSRVLPNSLADNKRVLREPIHALSLSESVLLARQLPHLRALLETADGRAQLTRVLNAAQGHPKLLDLAENNPDYLQQLTRASDATETPFLKQGATTQDAPAFLQTLENWTRQLSANLSPTARLLLEFLACLEEEDRQSQIVEIVWKNFLKRLADGGRQTADGDLASALAELAQRALVEISESESALNFSISNFQFRIHPSSFRLHPSIAETLRTSTDASLRAAVDIELGNFWIAVYRQGIKTEMQGGGPLVVQGGKRAAPYLMRASRWKEATALLERVIVRDRTPATLAQTIPLLQHIASATRGTEHELIDAGVLANALRLAGRYDEAEKQLRDLIAASIAQNNDRQASVNAGRLLNLLQETGQLQAALAVAADMSEYSRRAGLGPWTRLGDETRRLQILNALGRYREVLDAVQRLRAQMETLPETSEADETANPWNVREALLDTGRFAARNLEQWQTALELNAAIVKYASARGADAADIARTRFNDYFPLLRLRRFQDARALLEYCRAVQEQAHNIVSLGKVLSALADLEDKEGNRAAAVRYEKLALRYSYQAAQPQDIAISHNNLSIYLESAGAPQDEWLAHRLAATTIDLQTQSGLMSEHLPNLANSDLSPAPPAFDAVVEIVERLEGVRFREMFARRGWNGDEAIRVVWEMGREKVAGSKVEREQEIARILQEFDPLLRAIAVVANGDERERKEIEELLPKLQEGNWQISDAVQRIWNGERDAESLTAGIDANSAMLVKRVLEYVDAMGRGEALAQTNATPAANAPANASPQRHDTPIPPSVVAALQAQDVEALQRALNELPEEQAIEIIQKLRDAGIVG